MNEFEHVRKKLNIRSVILGIKILLFVQTFYEWIKKKEKKIIFVNTINQFIYYFDNITRIYILYIYSIVSREFLLSTAAQYYYVFKFFFFLDRNKTPSIECLVTGYHIYLFIYLFITAWTFQLLITVIKLKKKLLKTVEKKCIFCAYLF